MGMHARKLIPMKLKKKRVSTHIIISNLSSFTLHLPRFAALWISRSRVSSAFPSLLPAPFARSSSCCYPNGAQSKQRHGSPSPRLRRCQ